MESYALLILPSANRVYAESSVELTVAELEVFNGSVLGGRLSEIRSSSIAGFPTSSSPRPGSSPRDVYLLANLSTIYALVVPTLKDPLLSFRCCGWRGRSR